MVWVELAEWSLDLLIESKNKNIEIKHINNRTNSETKLLIIKI